MSKRTIIVSILAVLCFAAALFSLMFDYKSVVNEAQAIINGDQIPDEPVKVKKEKPVKEAKSEPVILEINESGIEPAN